VPSADERRLLEAPLVKSLSGIFRIASTHLKPGGMNSPNGTRWRLR
jgi:hypothetical protein